MSAWRRILWWVWLGILPFPPAWAQAPGPALSENDPPVLQLTLQEAIALALRHNSIVKTVYLDRILQKFDLLLARDEFAPQYSFQVSSEYQNYADLHERFSQLAIQTGAGVTLRLPTGGSLEGSWNSRRLGTLDSGDEYANGSAGDYSGNLALNFSHPLLKGAGREVASANLVMAEQGERANLLMLEDTLTAIVNQVISTYQGFMEARRGLEIDRRSFERAQELLAVNRAMIEAGRLAPFDIVEPEADLARQELSVKTSENNLDSARLDLLQVLNIDRRTRLQVEPVEFKVKTDIPPFEVLYRSALENRPDYLQMLISLENARTALKLARDNKRWALDAYAGYSVGRNASDYWEAQRGLGNLDRGGYQAGLTLIIPIDDKEAKRAVLGARVSLQQLELQLEQMRENIARDLEELLRRLEIQRTQVELARREIVLRERQLYIEKEKLKFNLNENKDVVSAQEALTNSQNSELAAIISYWNSLNELDNQVGTTLENWGIRIEQVETYHDALIQALD